MRSIRGAIVAGTLTLLVLAPIGCASSAPSTSPVPTSVVDLPPSYKFAPAAITVKAGTTVTWTNHDNFSHSVQFLDGGLPGDPRVMPPGQATTFTFEKPGLYHYQCSFHPQNMQGMVLVSAP